jgi:metallo-beta-lactamase family protein
MNITFHGAAQTVTGSRHLLSLNDHQLLLDCGLFQGRRKDTYSRNLNFPFDVTSLDGAILSHAHIDHSGNFPNLVKQGYPGSINATTLAPSTPRAPQPISRVLCCVIQGIYRSRMSNL